MFGLEYCALPKKKGCVLACLAYFWLEYCLLAARVWGGCAAWPRVAWSMGWLRGLANGVG